LNSLSLALPGVRAPAVAEFGVDRLGSDTPVFVATGLVGLLGAALVGVAADTRGERPLPNRRRS
jgi:hypothetical protein